jgi:hypothetical protein
MSVNRPTQTPTGLEEGATEAQGVTKVLIDGKLFIIRNGIMYDPQGKLVK